MNPRELQLRVGCSGWQYRHWRGNFYPAELPTTRWFAHYAAIFDTVEVNNTFYRLPETGTFERWRETMPDRFVAAIKASRFLTHMKKLLNAEEPIKRLFGRAAALGPRLGPVLYQLPPSMRRDLPRLENFLAKLPRHIALAGQRRRAVQHAIEFRDPSWYVPETFAALEHHGVALCLHDRAGSATPEIAVGPFIYVRFHGTSGAYHGGYPDPDLEARAVWLARQHLAGRDVYAYFNNDIGGMAPRDALTLRRMVHDALRASGRSASRSRAEAARSTGR